MGTADDDAFPGSADDSSGRFLEDANAYTDAAEAAVKAWAKRVTPQDYGCTGDGVTDDRANFQTMVDEVAASDGELWIHLLPGTYLMGTATSPTGAGGLLNFSYSNLTMIGCGDVSVIKAAPRNVTTHHLQSVISSKGTELAPLTNLRLENFKIDGNRVNMTGTATANELDLLDTNWWRKCFIRDVLLYNGMADGLDLDDTEDTLVEGCIAYNCNGNGFHISTNSAQNRIIGNYAEGNGFELSRSGFDHYPSAADNVYIGNIAKDNYRNWDVNGTACVWVGNHSLGSPTVVDTLNSAGSTFAAFQIPGQLVLATPSSSGIIRGARDVEDGTTQLAFRIQSTIDGVTDDRIQLRGDLVRFLQDTTVVGDFSATSISEDGTALSAKYVEPTDVAALDKIHATTTVADTVTETDLYRETIGAGAIGAGNILDLLVFGDYLNNSGSTVNLTLRIKLGATTVITTNAMALTTGASRRKFFLRVRLHNVTTGTQRVHCQGELSQAGSTDAVGGSAAFTIVGYGTASEDTTAAKDLAITAEHGTAASTIDIQLHAACLEKVA